jgi:hypothetical protein
VGVQPQEAHRADVVGGEPGVLPFDRRARDRVAGAVAGCHDRHRTAVRGEPADQRGRGGEVRGGTPRMIQWHAGHVQPAVHGDLGERLVRAREVPGRAVAEGGVEGWHAALDQGPHHHFRHALGRGRPLHTEDQGLANAAALLLERHAQPPVPPPAGPFVGDDPQAAGDVAVRRHRRPHPHAGVEVGAQRRVGVGRAVGGRQAGERIAMGERLAGDGQKVVQPVVVGSDLDDAPVGDRHGLRLLLEGVHMSDTSSTTVVRQPDVGAFRTVDLTRYANCVGIEPARRPGTVAFNIWGNGFPAEELPRGGSVARVGVVPFRFPAAATGRPDHVRCRGQRIALPGGRTDWLFVLAAAERRTEDPVLLHYADGTSAAQWLRVSDFWPETPRRFGEALAYRTSSMLYPRHVQLGMAPSLWQQRIPVSRPGELVAVSLPDNPAMHVLAMTVLTEGVWAP